MHISTIPVRRDDTNLYASALTEHLGGELISYSIAVKSEKWSTISSSNGCGASNGNKISRSDLNISDRAVGHIGRQLFLSLFHRQNMSNGLKLGE